MTVCSLQDERNETTLKVDHIHGWSRSVLSPSRQRWYAAKADELSCRRLHLDRIITNLSDLPT